MNSDIMSFNSGQNRIVLGLRLWIKHQDIVLIKSMVSWLLGLSKFKMPILVVIAQENAVVILMIIKRSQHF